ncbi:MAG: hypothetical protein RR603_05220, partial [Kurthia sp.]
MQGFISEHPTDKEIEWMQQWVGAEKMTQYEHGMDAVTLQHLLTDAYFFTYNKKEWGYFLIEKMKEIVQPRTHHILTGWQNPIFFIGTVVEIMDDFVVAEHFWTGETILIADVEIEDQIVNDLLLGHIVPGVAEPYYYLLSSAIILEQGHSEVLDNWKVQYEQSDYEQYSDYFEENILDCLVDLLGVKTISNSEIRDVDMDALQLIVNLDILLIDLDVKNDRLSFVFFNYLMDYGISRRMRKKEVLIAAIIDFGMRYDFMPRVITQRALAQLFQVSTSSINRYSKNISYYFDQDFDTNVFEKLRQPLYHIGTDARAEEYKQWQLNKHFEKMVFTNPVDKKRMEKKLDGVPFKPLSDPDNAQKYAYEAFLANDVESRQHYASLAMTFDVTNIDANIIRSEAMNFEERVVFLSGLLLTDDRNINLSNRHILLMSALLFENGQYDKAQALLESIEPK